MNLSVKQGVEIEGTYLNVGERGAPART